MTDMDIFALRYPIGRFATPTEFTPASYKSWKKTIKDTPQIINELLATTSETNYSNKYRPEGWNLAQIINHIADSHMNSLTRFKLGLTEDCPTIKPYEEAEWAKLADGGRASVDASLKIIDGVHQRWSTLLENMTQEDFDRKLFHPEQKVERTLSYFLALYNWHCLHHIGHIKICISSKGKYN